MKKHSLLTPALLLAMTSSVTHASGSDTYTDYFPNPRNPLTNLDFLQGDLLHTDWGTGGKEAIPVVIVKLAKFDPRLGALTSAELSSEVQGKAFGTVTNNVGYTTSIETSQLIHVTVDTSAVPAVGVNLEIDLSNDETFTSVPANQTVELTPFDGIDSASMMFKDKTILQQFIDKNPSNPFVEHSLDFPVTADGNVTFGQNTGNMASSIETLAGAKGTVSYNYITDNDVMSTTAMCEGGKFWYGTTPDTQETCDIYDFTIELSCKDGGSFNTSEYTLPAGCTAPSGLDSNPLQISCSSSEDLTNDIAAAHQNYIFPEPVGSVGECSLEVITRSCNGFDMGGTRGSITTEALPCKAPIGPPPPHPVPASGPLTISLLGGLLGLLGFGGLRRIRRENT